MPSKKKGKERLDKYYHLAKDQGYRARSAFKLIQLAKKFDFLSNSKVCLDLCAAPGGWSQVAERNMPAGSQIIAIDLAPIKALKGVTCIQSDITSEKCRALLRKEMRDKADCVLHDGAPNVGSSWAKDAFGQNELVLWAMKLACEHLKPGGCFVTKVFRSADYNSLLWVFNQLFHKVEATKPTASRNVSAEIFVICANFKAGKIDPRFFDSKWVFMENMDPLADQDADGKVKKAGASLNDYIKNLAKRRRGGYELGDDMRILSAKEFVDSDKPAELLIGAHRMDFEAEECKELAEHKLTVTEIREMVKDLKVLGKRDLGHLLKWRMKILRERDQLATAAKKEDEKLQLAVRVQAKKELKATKKAAGEGIQQDVDDAIAQFLDGAPEEDKDDDDDDDDEDSDAEEAKIQDELDEVVAKRRKEERIDAKKTAERQKKQEWRRKLSLNINTSAQDEPELLRANKHSIQALEDQDKYLNPGESDEEASEDEGSEEEDSDEELDRYAKMEVDLAVAHQLKQAHDGEKFRSSMQRKMKKKKETRRERVVAAWSGELTAFNEALDQKAHTAHLASNAIDDEGDTDDDDSDDSDNEKDLRMLRNQQKHLALGNNFAGVDLSAMESSLSGPEVSEAARALLDSRGVAPKKKKARTGGADDEDEEETALVPVAEGGEEQLREQHRAKRWFSQDIFKNVGSASSTDIIPLDRDSSDEDEEDESKMVELDDKDLPKMPLTDKEQRKLKRKKDMEKLERLGKKPKAKDTTPMEVAPLEAPVPLNMTGPHKPTDPRELAETLALGSVLIDSKKSRMDLIDASYNRWTFDGDEALPDWFTEDENKHNTPELPITKEMMDQFRAKLREINARPIRKVAEAKARKSRRLKLRLDKLRKSAMSLSDTPDMSEIAKARLMRKQVSAMMRQDQRRVTVVAIPKGGGGNRGKSEKGKVPKGAKLKVVDKRAKSDTRALKKAAKRNSGKINAKNRKQQLKKQRKLKGGGPGPRNTGGRGGAGIYGQGA